MEHFDRVLIDPSPAERDAALSDAAVTANQRAQLRLLQWPPDRYAATLTEVDATPEGWRQWNGGTGKGKSGEARSVVVLAWWTDFIGRKHQRVVGRRGNFNNAARKNMLAPGEPRPPLWLTYSENIYLRQREEDWDLVAVCPCGVAGAPREIGWMGTCCGPCHDRREGGEAIPRHPGDPARTVLGHERELQSVSLSRDGSKLVVQGLYGSDAVLWDVATGASYRIPGTEWFLSAIFSPNGEQVALGGARGEVRLEATGSILGLMSAVDKVPRVLSPFRENQQMVFGMEFSSDGQTLAVLHRHFYERDYPGEVAIWDVGSEFQLLTPASRASPVWAMALAPDGQTVALATGEQTITLWDARAAEVRGTFPALGSRLESLAYAPDGRLLAGGNVAGNVQIWDVATGRELADVAGHTGRVSGVAFTPDGKFLISAGHDASVCFWEVPSGLPRGVFKWHTGEIRSMSLAGPWLATGSADRTIKLWPWRSLVGA